MTTAQRSRLGLALALLASTQFVLTLDSGIMNVALPTIQTELGFAPEDLAWVTNAYALTFGGFLLLGGRGADLIGARRMFVVGLVLFTAASLAGAVAQTALWLVLARGVQGLAAALVSPAAMALVVTMFSAGAERNRALGVFGAMSGLGGAAGFMLGGVLTEWLGWPAVLAVNVPIGLAAILLAPVLLTDGRLAGARRSFDLLGAVSVTAGLTVLVYAIVGAPRAGWASAQTLGLLAIAAVLLAAFVVVESRAAQPLVPLGIFRQPMLRAANVLAVLMTASIFPFFFFVTLYLQQVLDFGPFEAGLGQLPVALAMAVAAGWLAAKLIGRYGIRPTLAAGLLVAAVGLAWFAQLSPDGSYLVDVFGPAVLVGVGLGFGVVCVTIAGTATAAQHEAGLASGLINTTQQMGGALGLAVLIALAAGATPSGPAEAVALTEGFQVGLLTGAVVALVGAVLTLMLLPGQRATPPAEVARPTAQQAS
ncbi:MFS transporter [Plantactinospora mayteni]|uniref:MFS transporter n=1 Tax=Plantactinospora mayteni TaxID=566021 RepID=A0ABQ4ER63_9ACTN|nr:MFS transporter [Plantactinospora mayteni]GIG97153.1 MFS transporter [Plantactinospora mayteni]